MLYDLSYIIKLLCNVGNLKVTKTPIIELESIEYNANRFELDNFKIVFRKAKITPIKLGLFVTLWKRFNSKIVPLNINEVDFVIIYVESNELSGIFIFNSQLLVDKKIISNEINKGKLAFRVYPPWIDVISKQAILTQKWQTEYFIMFKKDYSDIDFELLNKLLKFN